MEYNDIVQYAPDYSFLGPREEIELSFSHTHKKPRIYFVTKLQLYSQKHFIGVLMSVTQEAMHGHYTYEKVSLEWMHTMVYKQNCAERVGSCTVPMTKPLPDHAVAPFEPYSIQSKGGPRSFPPRS